MFHYLLLLILSLLLIVLQSTVTDIVFSNYFVFEVSLIIIIYAGFRFEMIKGLLLAFYLGFILDLIGGSVPGVLALAYIMIFLCSFFISDLLDTGKNHVIVLFSFICVFLKETMLQTFYFLVFDIRMRPDIFSLILIQSFVVGLVAPVVFHLIDRTGIFLYEKKA